MVLTIFHLPRKFVAGVIRCYQRSFSPDHGALCSWMFPYGYCRFYPTCSEYGRQAVLRYGIVRGIGKALWRVLRCNPWSRGGEDPVR